MKILCRKLSYDRLFCLMISELDWNVSKTTNSEMRSRLVYSLSALKKTIELSD